MAEPKFTMDVGNDGVAIIKFSNPPVNALSIQIFAGLKEKWNEAAKRNDVKAIVLTGSGGKFSGGFDINVFEKVHKTNDVTLLHDISIDLMTNVMEDGKKPAVAAVEGLCLGGGFKLALACHAHIAAPRTQLRLPDLRLGVLPGYVGTKHPPRLIGLSKSVEMMMTSKPIMSEEGENLGIIDVVVLSTELLKVARQWALDIIESRKPWDVDMVIEAVIENIPLKQQIFTDLEKVCPPHCILASNTSTIDLNIIGQKTRSQDQIIGAHFFSPAHVMPLLEIMRMKKTSVKIILDLMAVGKTIKKVPVIVGNCTGFSTNRTFFPYTQSAHFLANLRADVYRIDALITSFGLPIGPFQIQDLAGYKVAVVVGKEYRSAFFDRVFTSKLLDLLIKREQNGKNNGKGYYIYKKGEKPKPDPTVLLII
ncbi:Peroxisomal fatty acid beta-oxidation multifunctional protein [Capsicum annuum]|uniref:Peroxisomal fatty acid beta-oxidation multifunctional protein n=1 Tax=Capsicum annuum TaxID=4072 RepID=A0A2G2ZBZ7_CAPAN|nr:Peroxisomal fatty acid beta-oxidation multifunctional protein [Capsicum annuum]